MNASARVLLPEFTPGSVWLVGAGPGDPGLLTLQALGALEQADVILHDALIEPAVLALAGPAARLEPVGKRAGRASPKQIRINQRLIERARAGLRVVRLKGGDPFVFGRGGEEALALAAAGIPFRVVPGVTAGTAAAAAAGIPVTHRGIAQAVTFVTGHGAAGHPPASVDWQALAHASPTLVLFMALRRIDRIAAELLGAGRAIDEPVALIAEATTSRQTTTITTLGSAADAAGALPADRPTLIVIGPTVALHRLLAGHQEIGPSTVPAPLPAAPAQAAGS
ncbi:MAG TPA: uroporphyrinogen-III C-methyltransferase [Geminicoccaceae bacterium]